MLKTKKKMFLKKSTFRFMKTPNFYRISKIKLLCTGCPKLLVRTEKGDSTCEDKHFCTGFFFFSFVFHFLKKVREVSKF